MDTKTVRPILTSTPERHSREHLMGHFETFRVLSEELTEPHETEDLGIRAIENTNPAKWTLQNLMANLCAISMVAMDFALLKRHLSAKPVRNFFIPTRVASLMAFG